MTTNNFRFRCFNMARIPRSRDITHVEECSAERFDEEYLRIIKGQGFKSGYFFYPDGPVKRYLVMENGIPLMAGWDDGVDGRSTSLLSFFEPFLKRSQELTFCEADSLLISAMAVAWQQAPDAHTSPGLIDAAEMIKSLLRRNREFIVRLRRDAHTSFLSVGNGKILNFYFGTEKFSGGEAETKLVHELTANHAFLTIDVYENQEPSKAEDWALVPPDFEEGMIKYYCCSSPHLILNIGGREVNRVPFKNNEKIILGRDPSVDLVIDNLSVSRKHATAEFQHGICTFVDLGSKNGSFINGERVTEPTALNDGDEVVIGKHTIAFAARAMIKERTLDTEMLDRTVVMKMPQVTAAPKEIKKIPVITYNGRLYQVKRSPFSIGTAETGNLPVVGTGVKSIHALLEKDTSGQWWISHRGGMLSATRINGRKVTTAPLSSGDLVQIGAVMLRFQLINESPNAQ